MPRARDLVELPGRDARLRRRADLVEDLGRDEPASRIMANLVGDLRLDPHRAGREAHRQRPRRAGARDATADARALGPGEAFVVARDEVRLDLLHGVERDTDDDERPVPPNWNGTWKYFCRSAGIMQTTERYSAPANVMRVSTRSMYCGGVLAGRMPGTKPPPFFRLSATSTG
jgi:hypothetical protein